MSNDNNFSKETKKNTNLIDNGKKTRIQILTDKLEEMSNNEEFLKTIMNISGITLSQLEKDTKNNTIG